MAIGGTTPTLGVVGGGQLGRMLGEAASPLGVELLVSDPTPAAPASLVTRDQVVGNFDDPATIRELGERADVLTYEIELADPDVLAAVSEATGTPVHPAPETLRLIQDKFVQKQRLAEAGVPVPPFRAVDDVDALRRALDDLGYPAMLKAREGGYDGRGTAPVAGPDDVAAAMAAIDGPAMVEAFVDYECELAVIGCRGRGERATFPVTETIHREEILRETLSPARVRQSVRDRALAVARDVLGALSGRGVFGIELFATSEGKVLLNEVAPRPHNSGHWTIEGCHTSQFAQHVRAVIGQPLGHPGRRAPTCSANILGDGERRPARLAGTGDVLDVPRANLHWYGKRQVYDLRKMGHVTLVGNGEPTEAETPVGQPSLLAETRDLRERLSFAPADEESTDES